MRQRSLEDSGAIMRKLFAPNTRAIGRPAGPPSSDAVPATMIDGTPTKLRDDLVRILGAKQVLHRIIDSIRYAANASPYRLVPKVVVLPLSPMSLLILEKRVVTRSSAQRAGV